MCEHQHLRVVVETAQRNAEKVADADVDRHPHALDGTVQHDALAMKFYPSHAAVCAGVVRMKAERQRKRVEPHDTALPRRGAPPYCSVEPHSPPPPPRNMFP